MAFCCACVRSRPSRATTHRSCRSGCPRRARSRASCRTRGRRGLVRRERALDGRGRAADRVHLLAGVGAARRTRLGAAASKGDERPEKRGGRACPDHFSFARQSPHTASISKQFWSASRPALVRPFARPSQLACVMVSPALAALQPCTIGVQNVVAVASTHALTSASSAHVVVSFVQMAALRACGCPQRAPSGNRRRSGRTPSGTRRRRQCTRAARRASCRRGTQA